MTGPRELYIPVSDSSYAYSMRLIEIAGPGPVPAAKMALAGSMAGGIAGLIGTPFESIMVRYVPPLYTYRVLADTIPQDAVSIPRHGKARNANSEVGRIRLNRQNVRATLMVTASADSDT